jgi:hypothetical protein
MREGAAHPGLSFYSLFIVGLPPGSRLMQRTGGSPLRWLGGHGRTPRPCASWQVPTRPPARGGSGRSFTQFFKSEAG